MAAKTAVGAVLRPTQGFVSVVTYVRKHPSLVVMEIAWRWLFGIPACLATWHFLAPIVNATPWRATGVLRLSANDLLTAPERSSAAIAQAILLLTPPILDVAKWLAPVLILLWAAVMAVGRTFVLRRMDGKLHARPATLFALNLLRLIPLLVTVWFWWVVLSWVAQHTVLQGDGQMMEYVGAAIVLTFSLVVLWALAGWVFTIAPMLAMRGNVGPFAALRAAVQMQALRLGLVEINLVLGIVRVMLIVLLVALSSTPLPFQTELTGDFLMDWSLAMGVLYFLASDFFHVARLAGYLELGRVDPLA